MCFSNIRSLYDSVFFLNHASLFSGDIVGLSPTTADKATDELHSGIVTHVGQSALSVAFDDSQDLFSLADDQKYKLTKLANDVTYKRLKR